MIHWRHRWVAVGVQRMERVTTNWKTNYEYAAEPITEVLQRCHCGDVRTVTLSGNWSLEELTKEPV